VLGQSGVTGFEQGIVQARAAGFTALECLGQLKDGGRVGDAIGLGQGFLLGSSFHSGHLFGKVQPLAHLAHAGLELLS